MIDTEAAADDRELLEITQVNDTLQSGLRPQTVQQYSVHWRRWEKFAEERQWQPRTPTEIQVLIYLQDKVDWAEAHKSTNVVGNIESTISALKHYSDHMEKVLSSNRVYRFKKGLFHKFPPVLTKPASMWDPDKVLQYIKDTHVDQPALLDLAARTAFLLLISTKRRKGELRALSLDAMRDGHDETVFKLTQLPKMYSLGNQNPELRRFRVQEFPQDQRICQHTVLKKYIQKTEALRAGPELFCTCTPPFTQASAMTINRWILKLMSAAGIDTDQFKARSTRHASTSMAWDKGESLDKIMSEAGWRSRSTFAKHYRFPILTTTQPNTLLMVKRQNDTQPQDDEDTLALSAGTLTRGWQTLTIVQSLEEETQITTPNGKQLTAVAAHTALQTVEKKLDKVVTLFTKEKGPVNKRHLLSKARHFRQIKAQLKASAHHLTVDSMLMLCDWFLPENKHYPHQQGAAPPPPTHTSATADEGNTQGTHDDMDACDAQQIEHERNVVKIAETTTIHLAPQTKTKHVKATTPTTQTNTPPSLITSFQNMDIPVKVLPTQDQVKIRPTTVTTQPSLRKGLTPKSKVTPTLVWNPVLPGVINTPSQDPDILQPKPGCATHTETSLDRTLTLEYANRLISRTNRGPLPPPRSPKRLLVEERHSQAVELQPKPLEQQIDIRNKTTLLEPKLTNTKWGQPGKQNWSIFLQRQALQKSVKDNKRKHLLVYSFQDKIQATDLPMDTVKLLLAGKIQRIQFREDAQITVGAELAQD